MKISKTIIACLLAVCLLLPLAGCAKQENTIHPAGFDKYVPLLGWHREPILDRLELTAEDLTKKMVWVYALPDSVEYCGVSFDAHLEIDSEYRLFTGFFYTATFPQADEAAAEKIIAVAKYLTEALGIPYSVTYMAPDTDFISEITPAELVKALTEGDRSVTDYWSLGKIDTLETAALSAWSEGFDAGRSIKSYREYPPTLLLQLRPCPLEDGGFGLELRYTLDFYDNTWEQIAP